jgi:hypothetical protein
LFKILDGCVYTFFGRLSSNCQDKLDAAKRTIESAETSSKLDDLLSTVKTKLAPDGNM